MAKELTYEKKLAVAMKFVYGSIARPVLTGVFHDPDGSLVATDGMRLIRIEGAHDGSREGIILDKEGSEVDGHYPEYKRIIPAGYGAMALDIADITDWIHTHEDAYSDVKLRKFSRREYIQSEWVEKFYKDDSYSVGLNLEQDCTPVLNWWTPETGDIKGRGMPARVVEGKAMVLRYNSRFMVEALKAFRQLGCKEDVRFDFYGPKHPFKITAGKVTMVVSPIIAEK